MTFSGTLTWCRRVYLLRTTVRPCHKSYNQSFIQNQQEGGAAAGESFQSDGKGGATSTGFDQSGVELDNECNTEHIENSQEESITRGVGKYQGDLQRQYLMKPDQPPNARILRVAILGAPNAGKSTLVNNLIRWKANPVSTKVHTTRKNTLGLYTEENTQIVFTDTPGVMTAAEGKKHYCERTLVVAPRHSVEQVDLVGVLVDVSDPYTRGAIHKEILKILEEFKDIPSVLILNKVDELNKKDILLGLIRTLTEGRVAGSKIAAKTIQKSSKKKKEVNKILDRLEKKYDGFSLKAGLEKKSAESFKPPLASEINQVNNSLKRTGGQNLNDEKQKLNNTYMYVSEGELDGLPAQQLFDVASHKCGKDNIELKSLHERAQDWTENIKTDVKNDVKSEGNIAEKDFYDNTNDHCVNRKFEEQVNYSVDELHAEDVYDNSLGIDSEGLGLRKDKSVEIMERFKDENMQDPDDKIDKQKGSKKAVETDTKSAHNLLPKFGADKEDVGSVKKKMVVESSETSWEKLMPRDDEMKRGWPHFDRVFIVSSLYGDGMKDIMMYFLDNAKKGDWLFHSSLVTDEEPFQLAQQIVWTKILDHVKGYVAYQIAPEITYWRVDDDGSLHIVMNLTVKHVDKMIGPGGVTVGRIATEAQQDLMDAFRCEVKLKLVVKRLMKHKR